MGTRSVVVLSKDSKISVPSIGTTPTCTGVFASPIVATEQQYGHNKKPSTYPHTASSFSSGGRPTSLRWGHDSYDASRKLKGSPLIGQVDLPTPPRHLSSKRIKATLRYPAGCA